MFAGLVEHLAAHGEHIAVTTRDRTLRYRELAGEVASRAAELGTRRRLVLLEARNDLPTLTYYLGALAARHVVLPLPVGVDHTAVIDAYDPDVVIRGGVVTEAGTHRRCPPRDLHPDLALLLSTSGSTGSPKLVRLSTFNLAANAESIATYLGIVASDRAATTLPMSYCYGLSVIHSHLLRGAGLVLTDESVTDDSFWDLFGRMRATTFAGVPHTFDLLDRVGFENMSLPDLRYVTQAGGALAPDRVRRFAALGRSQGWRLFVMYGATEATARMAYLPPELAYESPGSIGVAIPGGTLRIDPVEGMADGAGGMADCVEGMADCVGELVYRGPNVMMGYAGKLADLASAAGVEEYRTGDIARRDADGFYEVIGRTDRLVKLYGLRIDLARVEASLRVDGVTAICTDGDGLLVVGATERPDGCDVVRATCAASGLPAAGIRVVDVDEIPRLPSGKPDYPSLRDLVADRTPDDPAPLDLHGLFADVLQVDVATIEAGLSFVDLGGNSLSYVAMSVRLERALGHLPADWQRLPLRELEFAAQPRRWWGATVETSVVLRAVAIILIVGSHAGLYTLWGGAHVLLGVAGYNFGRFCLTPLPRAQRARHLRHTIAWIAGPTIVWVAFALLVTNDYTASNLLLANKFLGPDDSMTAGRLWFVEVIVWILVALALVLATPIGDRFERRWPFGFAVAFLGVGLAMRWDLFGFGLGTQAWFTVLAFWYFAIGWVAAKSSTAGQRAAVTIVLAVGMVGYFGDPHRELLVFAGIALLLWLPTIRCPSAMAVAVGVVAEASLFIYLTHYQVYPLFGGHVVLGVIASIVVGVLVVQCVTMGRRWGLIGRLSPVRPEAAPAAR